MENSVIVSFTICTKVTTRAPPLFPNRFLAKDIFLPAAWLPFQNWVCKQFYNSFNNWLIGFAFNLPCLIKFNSFTPCLILALMADLLSPSSTFMKSKFFINSIKKEIFLSSTANVMWVISNKICKGKTNQKKNLKQKRNGTRIILMRKELKDFFLNYFFSIFTVHVSYFALAISLEIMYPPISFL